MLIAILQPGNYFACLLEPSLIRTSSYPKLSKCGVFAPDLVDPLLKETYKKLTKLPGQVISQRKCVHVSYFNYSGLKFISWKGDNDNEDSNGNGMILYSSIKGVHPKLDLQYISSF